MKGSSFKDSLPFRPLAGDLLVAFWLVLFIAFFGLLVVLFGEIVPIVWVQLSFGVALAFFCCELLLLLLWALVERWKLNPKSYGPGFVTTLLLALRTRFSYSRRLLVLPWLRRVFLRVAGVRTIGRNVLFDGPPEVDLFSFLDLEEGVVIELGARFMALDELDGSATPISVGRDTLIGLNCIVGSGARIGHGVIVGSHSVLGRECVIADGVVLTSRSIVPDGAIVNSSVPADGLT